MLRYGFVNKTGPRATLLVACFALLAGCGGDAPPREAVSTGVPEQVTYASELNVDLEAMERTPSGLYRRDLTVGQGDVATPGSNVDVHYTGWLPSGLEFDSSRGGAPFTFGLGVGEVIQGWDEGVAGMRVGGRRQLVIPPDLAYGARGAGGVIPPNATLVFDVELLGID